MAKNTQLDSLDVAGRMDFPYNRINNPLSEEPRFFRGINMFVTEGGTLSKRPGTLQLTNTDFPRKIERLWLYETEESPPLVYFLASMYDGTKYQVYYFRPGTSTTWTLAGSIRGLDGSSVPHETVIFQGKAYIRSVPTDAGDKYGAAIFDGTGGTIQTDYWGYPGPTTPAALGGANTAFSFLAADLDDSATSIDVDDGSVFPATPFVATIDFERVNVTNVAVNTLTIVRAYQGTTAASHLTGAVCIHLDWNASDHLVDVLQGWTYTYAFVTRTGQVTSRAPIQTNPDELPSKTGPFIDMKPIITVQGDADTTRIPSINIYRTRDGGGTYYFLEQITNTGSGAITYTDDSLESGSGGGTFNDPVPDSVLDQGNIAPTLLSNDPPPPINSGTVGTDDPEEGTPITEYAGRLWYAIGNRLFYSGREEISEGNPQECFPSGTFGNFFIFQYPIQNLTSTSDALYIFTLQRIYRVTGINKETFAPRPIYDSIGMPYGEARAITQWDQNIAFITHDYRVAVLNNQGVTIVSDPLMTDLVDQHNESANFQLEYWGDLEKEWLVINAHRDDGIGFTRQYIMDIKKTTDFKKPFWYVPWDIRAQAMLSGRVSEATAQRRLVFAVWDDTLASGTLVRIDPTVRTGTDYRPDTNTYGMDINAETALFRVPAGNHVNQLRVPRLNPTFIGAQLERTQFPGDIDPEVFWYSDDLWSDPRSFIDPQDPERRVQSKGYKTMILPANDAAHRVALKIWLLDVEIRRLIAASFPQVGNKAGNEKGNQPNFLAAPSLTYGVTYIIS
jgi:hypothetical protein